LGNTPQTITRLQFISKMSYKDNSSVSVFWDRYIMHQLQRVSKTSKIILVITTSHFHQIWQFLAQSWQTV